MIKIPMLFLICFYNIYIAVSENYPCTIVVLLHRVITCLVWYKTCSFINIDNFQQLKFNAPLDKEIMKQNVRSV